jgi:hypothetical protein
VPKKGNYNHDYYKVRGKEPGNQDAQPERIRKEYATARKKMRPTETTVPRNKGKRKVVTSNPKST